MYPRSVVSLDEEQTRLPLVPLVPLMQLPGCTAQVQSSCSLPATLDYAHPPCVTTTPCILKRTSVTAIPVPD